MRKGQRVPNIFFQKRGWGVGKVNGHLKTFQTFVTQILPLEIEVKIARLATSAHSMRVHATNLSLRKTLVALHPATACMRMLALLKKTIG